MQGMADVLAAMLGSEDERKIARALEEKQAMQVGQIEAYNLVWRAKVAGGLCGVCGGDLAPDEPVYMPWKYMHIQPMSIIDSNRLSTYMYVPMCEGCAPGSLKERLSSDYARGEASCGGCGRRVVWEEPGRYLAPRSGIFCCRRCESRYHNRARSEKLAHTRERVCEACGESFTASRRDARTCSPACKQAAYRIRKRGT